MLESSDIGLVGTRARRAKRGFGAAASGFWKRSANRAGPTSIRKPPASPMTVARS